MCLCVCVCVCVCVREKGLLVYPLLSEHSGAERFACANHLNAVVQEIRSLKQLWIVYELVCISGSRHTVCCMSHNCCVCVHVSGVANIFPNFHTANAVTQERGEKSIQPNMILHTQLRFFKEQSGSYLAELLHLQNSVQAQ